MALSDVASTLTTSLPHKTCGVCHALAGMKPDEAGILRDLLRDRGVKFVDLAKALADDPDSPTIKRDSLSRHANGGCSANERLR